MATGGGTFSDIPVLWGIGEEDIRMVRPRKDRLCMDVYVSDYVRAHSASLTLGTPLSHCNTGGAIEGD